jgi:hypothetical protein
MFVEASFDPAIGASNYLPPRMDEAKARAYCAGTAGVVLRSGGTPAGVAVILPEPDPGVGVEIPEGCVELDVWVLAPFRGQVVRWFPLIQAWMAERYPRVLGVIWEDHHTAKALLRWSGWRHLGRSFWSRDGCSGQCDVFLLELLPPRTT